MIIMLHIKLTREYIASKYYWKLMQICITKIFPLCYMYVSGLTHDMVYLQQMRSKTTNRCTRTLYDKFNTNSVCSVNPIKPFSCLLEKKTNVCHIVQGFKLFQNFWYDSVLFSKPNTNYVLYSVTQSNQF